MKPEIKIDYPTLRQATEKVLRFTQEQTGIEDLNLRTSIADDLSLFELDGYIFLDNFQQEFNVPLTDRAYDYVCPESLKGGFFRSLLFILTLPIFIVFMPLTLIFKSRESKKQKIRNNCKELTLGDLAASLALGKFIKREEVLIVI